MSDGGGLSVEVGDIVLVAGVHLGMQMDTLIHPSDKEYQMLLELKVGDTIKFGGKFPETPLNTAISLNYSGTTEIERPSFLFKFDNLDKLN